MEHWQEFIPLESVGTICMLLQQLEVLEIVFCYLLISALPTLTAYNSATVAATPKVTMEH